MHLAEAKLKCFWRLNYNHEWDPPDWWGCHQRRWSGRNDLITPQNLHVPHPPKMLNVNLGEMQKKRKAFKWNALPIYVFTELLSLGWVLSIELWIDFVFSMWSRLFFIRCWRDVTERAKACPGQQKLFLYAETIESGVNNRVKRGKWEEKNFR